MSNARPAPTVHGVMVHALFIMAPLATGLMIYLVHRAPVTWLHVQLFEMKGGGKAVPGNWLENFYLFHLPDVLWAFSMSYALCCNAHRYKKQLSPILVLGAITIFECLQLFSTAFTFDWLDLAFELMAGLAGMIVFKKMTS